VSLRYQLSKTTYRYEFINHPSEPIDRIKENSLAAFDLLIIDSDALQSLSSAETRELKKAVNTGLGMTVLFNTSPQKIRNLAPFLDQEFKTISSDTAQLRLTNGQKITLPAWPVQPIANDFTFITAKNKVRALAGYQYNGSGKVGYQLLQETYRLALEGDSVAYSSLWSDLLEKTSRTRGQNFFIQIENPFPIFENDPIDFSIISSGSSPIVIKDSVEIPLIEDVIVDDVWHGRLWDGKPGWHSLTIREDSTALNYYISEKGAWPSLVEANNQVYTSLKSTSTPLEKKLQQTSQPVPPWIFYVTFLLCAGFLWLAPKL
jgi:hypothetical protein